MRKGDSERANHPRLLREIDFAFYLAQFHEESHFQFSVLSVTIFFKLQIRIIFDFKIRIFCLIFMVGEGDSECRFLSIKLVLQDLRTDIEILLVCDHF